MKILIIGKDSYIGNHIDEWLVKAGHQVEQLDVLTEDWKTYDYSPYDAIVHVAGIVHRPNCQDWELYHNVNTLMPLEIAKKFRASISYKLSNSKLFVYFSTMGVYDAEKKLHGCMINSETPMLKDGNSMYGKSKLMAEEGLKELIAYSGELIEEGKLIDESGELRDDGFKVAIVRPPSVYGKGCKGGYITGFRKIASLLPVIPQAYEEARQSFIYIDNLCECVRLIVENGQGGVFCPQDDEIPNANRLLEVICEGIGKKYRASRLLGWCMRLVSFIPLVRKAYGGIAYARELSDIPGYDYVVVPFREGMKRTVSNG